MADLKKIAGFFRKPDTLSEVPSLLKQRLLNFCTFGRQEKEGTILATKKVTITIDEDVYKSLTSRFPDITDKPAVFDALARLAITEWDGWFAARLRPKSMSALAQERMRMIFREPALYANKRLTRGVLFNQFNLPYGESAYIERVFAELDQPAQITPTLQKIIDGLEKQIQDWTKDKHHKLDQSFTIEVDKLGQRLLQAVMQQAKENGSKLTANETALAVHGYYNYTFTKDDAQTVVNTAKNLLQGQTP